MMMMAPMFFHWFNQYDVLLFKEWNLDETGKLVGAAIGLFFISFCYEALKFGRERCLLLIPYPTELFDYQTMRNSISSAYQQQTCDPQQSTQSTAQSQNGNSIEPQCCDDTASTRPLQSSPVQIRMSQGELWRSRPTIIGLHFTRANVIQTILHMIQICLSYLLMLAAMTYNAWLFIAIVLGSGLGYFVFGWRKATFADISDHCH